MPKPPIGLYESKFGRHAPPVTSPLVIGNIRNIVESPSKATQKSKRKKKRCKKNFLKIALMNYTKQNLTKHKIYCEYIKVCKEKKMGLKESNVSIILPYLLKKQDPENFLVMTINQIKNNWQVSSSSSAQSPSTSGLSSNQQASTSQSQSQPDKRKSEDNRPLPLPFKKRKINWTK